MKATKKHIRSKGDRLNWLHLKDVRSVSLSGIDIKGHVLTAADLRSRSVQVSKVVLVP